MLCPRCQRATIVEDSRGSDSPEAMTAQVRAIRAALTIDPRVAGLADRLPFRLRRRRCERGHRTWSVEADRTLILILLDRLDLDESLP